MAEDKKLVSREEVACFSNFLGSDGGDGAAGFLFGFAAQKDLGGRFEAAKKWHGSPIVLILLEIRGYALLSVPGN